MTACKFCGADFNVLMAQSLEWDSGVMTSEYPPSVCPVSTTKRHTFTTPSDYTSRCYTCNAMLTADGLCTVCNDYGDVYDLGVMT